MTYGQIVAERYKRQYFTKSKGWTRYEDWQTQPEEYYIILLEISSKRAIAALLNESWTRYLPRRFK